MIFVYGEDSGKRENLIAQDTTFNDGTFHLNIQGSRDYQTFTLDWRYENDAEAMKVWFIVKHLRDKNPHARIHLYVPYVPNARMDRVKTKGEVFTLKYFAKFLNELKFDSIDVFDVHSDVALGLINSMKGYESRQEKLGKALNTVKATLSSISDKPLCVVFPDKSSPKRYEMFFDNTPLCFCDKDRDWVSGKIIGQKLYAVPDNLTDYQILIIDDIIGTGGTINGVVNLLSSYEVKQVAVYASHTEDNLTQGVLWDNPIVTNFFTSDSRGYWYNQFHNVKLISNRIQPIYI